MATRDDCSPAASGGSSDPPLGPFIHRFRTDDHYYVYDVNTNRILQVDRTMWDVLGTSIDWHDRDSLRVLLPSHSDAAIASAVRKCESLRREWGVLSSFRPSRLSRIHPRGTEANLYARGLEHLIIEVTQSCNLRCRYCVFSSHYPLNRGYSDRTIAEAVAQRGIDYFLEHVADTELPCIGFYGGEPLLAFGMVRHCIEYALDRRGSAPLHFQLTTNGTGLDDEMIEYRVARSVTLLVSLDGPPHCHDRNRVDRSGAPTAARVLENLERIRTRHGAYYSKHIGIVAVIPTNTDPSELWEYFEEHRELVQNGVLLCNFVSDVNTDYWESHPPSEAWQDALSALRWRFYESLVQGAGAGGKVLESLFQSVFVKIYRRSIYHGLFPEAPMNGCCIPGVRRLYLDCEGRYHTCERIGSGAPIGDVEHGIDPERVCELVDAYCTASEEECCQCWLVRLCAMCFANCLSGDRFDAAQKRRGCAAMRESVGQALADYCQIAELNPAAFQYMEDIMVR